MVPAGQGSQVGMYSHSNDMGVGKQMSTVAGLRWVKPQCPPADRSTSLLKNGEVYTISAAPEFNKTQTPPPLQRTVKLISTELSEGIPKRDRKSQQKDTQNM